MKQFKMKFYKDFLEVDYTAKGVTRIQYVKSSSQNDSRTPREKKMQAIIERYMNGQAQKIALAIDWDSIQGTDFQKQVWQRLAQIPFGETLSYSEIAQSIGRPKAARAVGTACGANPVMLAVACHRVVGAAGLGGFSGGGLPMKRKLLAGEGLTQADMR